MAARLDVSLHRVNAGTLMCRRVRSEAGAKRHGFPGAGAAQAPVLVLAQFPTRRQ